MSLGLFLFSQINQLSILPLPKMEAKETCREQISHWWARPKWAEVPSILPENRALPPENGLTFTTFSSYATFKSRFHKEHFVGWNHLWIVSSSIIFHYWKPVLSFISSPNMHQTVTAFHFCKPFLYKFLSFASVSWGNYGVFSRTAGTYCFRSQWHLRM